MGMDECRRCGAAVVSAEKHDHWHADVDKRLDGTQRQIDDVEDRVDQAAFGRSQAALDEAD